MNTTITKFSPHEISSLVKLSLPLILNGFLESSVGFFSTFFLAHLGMRELAAGAIVQWVFFTMMVILWGTLCSVSVLVAQKFGEKNHDDIAETLRSGLVLALLLSLPTVLLLWNIAPILLLAGQSPATASLAQSYMRALAWGMPFDFIAIVMGQFLIGLGHTRTTMSFTLVWVPVNILCNYAFIFGKFGVPALGMAGIGWGTSFAFILLAIAMGIFLYCNSEYRPYIEKALHFKKPTFLIELSQIGIPMGSMYCIEVAFFLTITLLMGHFGAAILAANQITLQFFGQLSVVTFSIAQAVTVRIGHTLGANDPGKAERAVYIGGGMALGFMIVAALLYWTMPEMFIGFDINIHDPRNAEIIQYAVQFLAIGAFFQLVESIRFTLFGALRGLKDTRFTLLASIISFWGISLPVGYFFAAVLHLNGAGLWWGVVFGQSCGTLILYARFRYKVSAMYRYAAFN